MGMIYHNGLPYGGGGSSTPAAEKELTYAEYLALSEEEKNNGTTYYITDVDNNGNISGYIAGDNIEITKDKVINVTKTNSDIVVEGNPVILKELQGGVPFSEITVKGENISGQEMTLTATGKNQLPITATSGTGAGVTYTVDNDEISVNGTTTGVATITVSTPNMAITQDMRLSYRGNLSGMTPKATVLRNGETVYPTPNDTTGSKLLAGDVLQNVYIQQQSADVVVSGSAKFQLEYGTEVTEYEKYSSEICTFTPDSIDYIIPTNITQKENVNVLAIDKESATLSVTGVRTNVAVAKLWNKSGYTAGSGILISEDKVISLNNEVISNPNLLVNPDFKINQRGLTEYTTVGYTVDRWRNLYGTQVKAQIVDNGILVGNTDSASDSPAVLSQYIENYDACAGKNVTISTKIVETTSNVAKLMLTYVVDGSRTYSQALNLSAGICSMTVQLPDNISELQIWIYGADIRNDTTANQYTILNWVKLELGSVATQFIPPNTVTEKIKCGIPDDTSTYGYQPVVNADSTRHVLAHSIASGTDVLAFATSDNVPTFQVTTLKIPNSPTCPTNYGYDGAENDFFYTIYKVDNSWIRVKAYDIRGDVEFINSCRNGTWNGWVRCNDGGIATEVNSATGKAKLYETSTEGGNLRLTSPDGTLYMEEDCYNNTTYRKYVVKDGANKAIEYYNSATNTNELYPITKVKSAGDATQSQVRNLSSGTAAADTTNCPSGAWYGQHS